MWREVVVVPSRRRYNVLGESEYSKDHLDAKITKKLQLDMEYRNKKIRKYPLNEK